MPSKLNALLLAVLSLGLGCPAPAEDPAPQAPAPIGGELLRVEGTWAWPACVESHLYRHGRALQYQCFDSDGLFSWENRGSLTAEASNELDAAIMGADLDDDDPVNYMGFCGAQDAVGTVTMWVGERSLSFAPFCLLEGIVNLYEEVSVIEAEISNCEGPFTKVALVEPGCRAY